MKRFELQRHKMGLTIQQLADKVKVNVSTVSTWENGKKVMTPKYFKALLDLGFDEKALINPTEEI